jgi:hypothetical protein
MVLNDEQQAAVDAIASGDNVCLSGEAGAGKTYTLREAYTALRRRYPGKGEVLVVASAGVAAKNIELNAITVHSAFGIGIGRGSVDELVFLVCKNRGVVSNYKRWKAMILEEVSSVSASLFDKLDEVTQRIRGNALAFGGLQVVAVGDFLQTAPIGDADDPNPKYVFESAAWKSLGFRHIMLQTQNRLSDPEMLLVMRRMRVMGYDAETRAELIRLTQDNDPDDFVGPEVIHLYATNEEVDKHNAEVMAALPGQTAEFDCRALDTLDPAYAVRRQPALDAANAARAKKNQPALQSLVDLLFPKTPGVVTIKQGAPVMLVSNLKFPDYVNGARGIAVAFRETLTPADSKTLTTLPLPVVRFEGGAERIVPMRTQKEYDRRTGAVVASRTQIPLRVCAALTVDKSIGLTLDRVVLHLARVWSFDRLYVALTRVRDRSRMLIDSLRLKPLKVPPAVSAFLLEAFGVDESARLESMVRDIERAEPAAKRCRVEVA